MLPDRETQGCYVSGYARFFNVRVSSPVPYAALYLQP